MPKNVKEVVETPEVKEKFELNLELGRQDLNDNFRKIEDAINTLINK